jgi:hypothetical protein
VFFQTHWRTLLWMAFVVVILRPLFIGLHDLLVNQTLNPGMTNMVRWQHHRYVLRQSLAFFQNDFAGRVANRIMQTAPSLRESAVQVVDAMWYVSVYAGTSVYLFAKADLRLAVPLVLWIAGYIGMLVFFVPRVKERSWHSSEARSRLMGRIVDGYSNIMTLKLFAHTNREEAYAREAMAEQTGQGPRAEPHGHDDGFLHHLAQRPAHRRDQRAGAVALGAGHGVDRAGGAGRRPGHPYQQHVRLDHVGGERHLR